MIEVPSKEDYVSLANRHNELVELVKSASSALGKMQEELDAMPSGYRNAQDIKNLKARIERLEARDSTRTSTMDEDTRRVFERVLKMEECCKNTVASGKELEKRIDVIQNNGLGSTDIRELVRDIVRDILKSL